MEVKIRKARLLDANAIWQINRDNWKHVFCDVYSKERIENVLKRKLARDDEKKLRDGVRKGYRYYVAVSGGKVAGALIYKKKGRIINVGFLYVDIKRHGNGIGTALVNYLERKERAQTYTLTAASRKQTIKFYEKMGYRKLRSVKTREGDTDIIMIKRVDVSNKYKQRKLASR